MQPPQPEDIEHPIFAWFYQRVSGMDEGMLADYREELVASLAGRVLDLGAGVGASFPYFARLQDKEDRGGDALAFHAVEPDVHMLRRARKRAEELALDIDLRRAVAEDLPYPDNYFDTVMGTVVFCTVQDVSRALGEVERVLAPGGRFLFLEHVRAPGAAGRWQDRITPVWRFFGAGCHLNRPFLDHLRQTDGLRLVESSRDEVTFPLYRLTWGTAEKAA